MSASGTSIWRGRVTICSALNLFFGMTQAPFQAHFLTSLGSKKPGQVNANNWRDAANIRIYVVAAREALGGIVDQQTIERWSQRALAEADKLDPITSDRIFGFDDQQTRGVE